MRPLSSTGSPPWAKPSRSTPRWIDDAELDTLALVAREASENTGSMSDAAWQAALEAGWSHSDLADAFVSIAINLATNYFTHYAGTQLDLPAAPPLPLIPARCFIGDLSRS